MNNDCLSFTCQFCGGHVSQRVFHFTSPPDKEIRFVFSDKEKYSREILCCSQCGHYYSIHCMDSSALYSGEYVDANYCDSEGIKRTYDRIMALDPDKSDNVRRVHRILEYSNDHFNGKIPPSSSRTVLDVGSGLCVFLARMKSKGWECTAVDPDSRAVHHAKTTVGVPAFCSDFVDFPNTEQFDLITFNRVLEHVVDPIAMLNKAKDHLKSDGLLYIEVPDGETAAEYGFEREEFTIDHLHIFSFLSLIYLIQNAGIKPLLIERVREPSAKYSLLAYCKKID